MHLVNAPYRIKMPFKQFMKYSAAQFCGRGQKRAASSFGRALWQATA